MYVGETLRSQAGAICFNNTRSGADMAKKETAGSKTTTAKASAKSDGATGARKVNPALMKPLQPSKELGAVVGNDPLPRPQVVKKVWDYIKANNLQDPKNKRDIIADAKLRAVFGKDKVSMFEMNKHLAAHLK